MESRKMNCNKTIKVQYNWKKMVGFLGLNVQNKYIFDNSSLKTRLIRERYV